MYLFIHIQYADNIYFEVEDILKLQAVTVAIRYAVTITISIVKKWLNHLVEFNVLYYHQDLITHIKNSGRYRSFFAASLFTFTQYYHKFFS